ncbi:MAG TPA: ABC transporter substrate-binding protein [Solirubrobacteraceae bacterium]|nr:ABC transporter substrate-binding protein [Solirubrobacteraceae bacterium]
MSRMLKWATGAVVAVLVASACGGDSTTDTGGGGETANQGAAKAGGSLTVALAEDPDLLDPTLARTFVGRIVFANLCEKLYDVNEKLEIVPQLAASLPKITNGGKTVTIDIRPGLKFNDGTTLDAKAVKTSLDRHRTLEASSRASELEPVKSVRVVDSDTVRLSLDGAYAPLTAQLADRSGMVMSPAQLDELGDKFSDDPVCVGPFEFVRRAEGDRIELKKASNYYDAGKVKLDRLTFRIIEEGSARSANLRSGDVNVAERLDPTDLAAVRADSNLQLVDRTSLGYQGITVNIGNKNGLGEDFENVGTPLAEEKALRQAFSLALDREAINKVVFQGNYVPGCGPLSPVSPYYDKSLKCPARDLAKAKQLVQQSGVPTPVPVRMMVNTDATTLRLGQTIQAMAKEAGFNVRLQPTEFTTALDRGDAGDYDTFQVGWSGRIDPDGNIQQFVGTTGSQNIAGYSNDALDKLLEEGRSELDRAKRIQIYQQATQTLLDESPLIYLYHDKYFTGAGNDVVGLQFFGDGLLRFKEAGFSAES